MPVHRPTRIRTRLWAVGIALVAAPALTSQALSSSHASGAYAHAASHRAAATSAFRFFAPGGVWNAPVASNAPLDTNSAAIARAFAQEAGAEATRNMLNINTTAWSVPIYTVPRRQPRVRVRLDKPNASRRPLSHLQAAWAAVPLPRNAVGARGTDKHLAVWQPSTGRLWEFFAFENKLGGPVAEWGGAIRHVSRNPGYYDSRAWPHAQTTWGASASSLSIVGGLITLEDLRRGRINHALAIGVPDVRAKVYAAPAQRTDGNSTDPLSLPEGAHLRLDPRLDVASLKLPRLVAELAQAAQRYGIVVRDRASNITFYAQDPTPTGTNPYLGRRGYFEGRCVCKLLASFPWSHLQLLRMDLHGAR